MCLCAEGRASSVMGVSCVLRASSVRGSCGCVLRASGVMGVSVFVC